MLHYWIINLFSKLRRLTTLVFLLASGTFMSSVSAQMPTLEISGADDELEQNIATLVSLPTLDCDAQLSALNRYLPNINQRTVRAGRALGYYFLTQQTEFITSGDCWSLHITVEPGEPVRIANVNVEIGGDEELFGDTINELPLSPGDQLNHARYERIKSNLSARAIELGYFSARFESSELQLDLQQNIANVDIMFQPGLRFQFGEVNIEPIEALSTEFIRRYVNFEPGTNYSAQTLIDLRNALNGSLYFNEVTVTPDLDSATNQIVPVNVLLQTRPRRVYSVGAGLTTDIGPRIRLDYEDRYINENGHSLIVKSGASPVQQSIDVEYTIPLENPATQRLTFLGGVLREDNDTYKSDNFKLGANYSFMNRIGWRQNYFVSYLHDNYSINDEDEISDALIGGINITRTRADDAIYPNRGWRIFAEVSGASREILSTESFAQFNLKGKYVRRLGPGRVLIKFEAGTTIVDDIDQLPTAIQYFSGGDQSVRGYKYQSLGPLNDDGEVIGGKHLLVSGVEYDFHILPNWKLALFTDAGNAFSNFDDYELKKSAGLGVRWLSPVGPIRVDLAYALDDDKGIRLHITMGPDL